MKAEFLKDGTVIATYDSRDEFFSYHGSKQTVTIVPQSIAPHFDSTDKPEEKNLTIEVTDILSKIGIPRNIKGFNYLREAIILSVDDQSYIQNITKALYPKIAQIFDTTPSRAERAIRHAIEVGFSRGNAEAMDAAFGYVNPANWKATNSEFISTIADNLKLEIEGTEHA